MGTPEQWLQAYEALPADDPKRVKNAAKAERARKEIAKKAQPSLLEAVLRGAGQGASLGFADEIAGGIGKLRGQNYDDALATSRARFGAAKDAHTGGYYGGEIGGAIASLLGGPAGVGNIMGRGGMLAAKNAGAMRRLAQGIGTGAAEGAVAGFGHGEGGAANRAETAAIGGTLGGVVGGAAIPATAAVAHGGRGLVRGIAKARGDKKPSMGLSPKVEDLLAESVAGQDIVKIREQLTKLGPRGTLGDLDKTGFPVLSEAVAHAPGPGAVKMTNFSRQRMEGREDRLRDLLTRNFGTEDPIALKQTQKTYREETLSPAYEEAFDQGFMQPAEAKILHRDLKRDIMTNAGPQTRREMKDVLGLLNNAAEDGKPIPLKKLHRYRSEMSDRVNTSSSPTVQKDLRHTLNMVDASIASQAPQYGKLQDLWHKSKAAEEAVDLGRDIFSTGSRRSGLSDRDVSDALAKMNPNDQRRALAGARGDLERLIDTDLNAGRKLVSDFQRPMVERKLGRVIGDDNAAGVLNELDAERAFQETSNRVLGGSQTARRQAAQDHLSGADSLLMSLAPDPAFLFRPDGALTAYGRSQPVKRTLRALQRTGRKSEEIGDIMTRQGDEALALMDKIRANVEYTPKTTGKPTEEMIRALLERLGRAQSRQAGGLAGL